MPNLELGRTAISCGHLMKDAQNRLKQYIQTRVDMPADALEEFISFFHFQGYNSGEFFTQQGEYCNKIGFVCDGLFNMYILKEDGSWFTKMFMAKNEFLLGVFDVNEKSTICIQALTDAAVVEAKYSHIQKQFSKHLPLGRWAKRKIEKVLEQTYSRLEQFAILEAKERYLLFRQEFGHIANLIPQYMIASYLGITPTQLSRIRKQMQTNES